MLDFLYTANAKKLLVASFAVAIIILAATKLLFIAVLIGLSLLLSVAIGQWNIRAIGLELVTFITILSSLTYGTLAGAIIGLVLIVFHIAIPHYSGAYVIWVIPEYALAAILANILSGNVASVGITVTLVLNAINILFTFIAYKPNLGKYLPYAFTNIIFNFVLFSQAGEFVLGLMK